MKTILVIEDNPAIGENTVELLDLLGFRTVLAVDGRQGLDVLYTQPVDFVLCDVLMPELDGYDVLSALRATASIAQLPFYFLSALSEPVDQAQGIRMGATGYLVKPFTEADLVNCLYRHLPAPASQQAVGHSQA